VLNGAVSNAKRIKSKPRRWRLAAVGLSTGPFSQQLTVLDPQGLDEAHLDPQPGTSSATSGRVYSCSGTRTLMHGHSFKYLAMHACIHAIFFNRRHIKRVQAAYKQTNKQTKLEPNQRNHYQASVYYCYWGSYSHSPYRARL
jgi:hypothetical protein